jgi:ribosome-binding protein aMBF1 (putative translation factor)
MPMGIIVERIQSLPQDDKHDLYELFMELLRTEAQEDQDSIATAMREILDQKVGKLKRVEQPDPEEGLSDTGLQTWIDYVSQQIKKLREQRGMTQVELAEKSGLKQSHICRLERGRHSPSHKTVVKIAEALGVPVTELAPSA